MLDKLKPILTQSSGLIESFVVGVAAVVNIGALLEVIHTGVAIGVSLATLVWIYFRVEKLLHEKRNRKK